MITMEDYLPGGMALAEIPGLDPRAVFADVVKSLQATPGLPRTGQTGVNALGVEDLSPRMASSEIKWKEQLHFWKDIPKRKAWSLTVEYSRLEHLSNLWGQDGFIADGDSGLIGDQQFDRSSKAIKYLHTKGSVSRPTSLIRAVTSQGAQDAALRQQAEEHQMARLLILAERNLFWAAERINPLQWDGVFEQIDAEASEENQIRLDMEGNAPDEDFLERCAQIMANNSSDPNRIYLPNEAMRDLRQALIPRVRMGELNTQGRYGRALEEFLVESLGRDPQYVQFRRTQMLTAGVKNGIPWRESTVQASAQGPAAPTAVTVAAAAHTATTGHAGLTAGTYYYGVTAVGKGGRSLATVSLAVAPVAGQKVTLSIACNDANCLYFEVFRNKAGESGVTSSGRYFQTFVPRSGLVTTWDDDGYSRPDTYHMGVFTLGEDELSFDQLLPPLKVDLPVELMGLPFGILLFGTPIVRVPIHQIHVVNCGKRPQTGTATAGP